MGKEQNIMVLKQAAMAAGLAILLGTGLLGSGIASAENAPGVTPTEIKIGQTMPYSGPASAYAAYGRLAAAYFAMINAQGGINGRKLTLLSEDDSYSPSKAIEATKKLVEKDKVALMFETLGTPSNAAIEPYLNEHKVPQLFVASGADQWGDYRDFPWTIGWIPSYRVEASIYGKYIVKNRPNAKIGIFYQNDAFGKDFIAGLKDALGNRYDQMVVKEEPYEPTDLSIDNQIEALQASGADTLVTAATPKFAARVIHKVYSLNWKPLHFLAQVATSVAAVVEPVGREKAVGIISSAILKDPADPAFDNDSDMQEWRAFMAKYMPDADTSEIAYTTGYVQTMTVIEVLKHCGDDLSRENIMKQATNLHDWAAPLLLDGIKINTSPTNYHPIQQELLTRFDGHRWVPFSEVLSVPRHGWWDDLVATLSPW
jgi:branched-chain amino acid transport system substrate-binding protein